MALGDRKEAEMKPTPRSARMGAIADALMAARNFADKAQVPEAVPLIGGQGLGSLVLGKAPEELNEMSYGNMPMRINPLAGRTASYVPEMKRGRKEQVADLAMLAGVPRVGKAGVGLAGVGDVGSGVEKAGLLARKADESVSLGDDVKIDTRPPKSVKGKENLIDEEVKKINFDKWFEGSKVKTKEGTPLVVYTGTSADVDFKKFKSPKNGIWFSSDPKIASEYAISNDSQRIAYEGGKYVDKNTASRVIPVYLSLKNPKVYDVFPDKVRYATNYKKAQAELFDELRREGHDGVIGGDVFVVFSPEQIKSVFNKGTYDPESKDFGMAKGGMMKPKINGFQDGGTAVEHSTGNDVPVGALPNEVADDIDAKLSEGEFVIPADVVRYIGLERLMKLRDDAKKGLQRMAQIGQMGNAEEVGAMANSTFEGEDEEDTGQFESDIDEILAEDEGANGQTERMMAAGGLATMPFATGSDLSKAPKNPVFDVRYLKHPDGRTIYVTYYNGKPFTPIPEGFKEVTQEEALKSASAADEAKKAAEKKTETTQQQAGASAGDVDSGGPTASTSTSASMPGTVLGMTPMTMQTIGKGMATVPTIPTMLLGKGLQALSNTMAQEATNASMGAVSEEAQAQAEAMGVTAPATSGMAASNAAVAAADAAINAGHSNEASIAAANAAATAVNQGATGEQAASIAAGAAAAVDAGADTSGNTSAGTGADVGDSVSGVDTGGGVGVMAKGGLVGKRKPKAKRGKGIVAQK